MKVSNSELILYLDRIDKYDDSNDRLVDRNTKANLKGFLIGGGDPESNNFKERMHDEYYLFSQIRNKK